MHDKKLLLKIAGAYVLAFVVWFFIFPYIAYHNRFLTLAFLTVIFALPLLVAILHSRTRAINRHAIAVKFLMIWRYGYAMSHYEYLIKKKEINPLSNQSTQTILNICELILLCSAKDGLDPAEKDWVLGLVVSQEYNDTIINFIRKYTPPTEDADIDRRIDQVASEIESFYGNRNASLKRHVIFTALLAADADGIISDKEYDKIKEIALRWNIKTDVFVKIRKLVTQHAAAKQEQINVIFPEVASKISLRNPDNG
jgi:tellurite resistance protein